MAKENKMSKGIWENKEVKELFDTVESVKTHNKPIKEAFIVHGEKYKRKPNSVRNYYYHEIDNLQKDKTRLDKLGIDITRHNKNEINFFSSDEEMKIIKQIDEEVKNGMSVRRACFNLSNGDANLMLRYQNKYRNFSAKNKVKNNDNIVQFKKKETKLSDSELQALFMGIVRLVKKSAAQEVLSENKFAINRTNMELRKALVSLSEKQNEIERLKTEFLKIKEENVKLMDDIIKLRSDKANKLREKLLGGAKLMKATN